MNKIILASKSPRRCEILQEMKLSFEVFPSLKKEVINDKLSPVEIVKQIALFKGQDVASQLGSLNDKIVISADTIVLLNGEILTKPKDEKDAFSTLKKLSGKKHSVLTAFAIITQNNTILDLDSTDVYFNNLTDEQIELYIKLFKPLDKAGSYGIQDDFPLVEKFVGSYFNVVGLPKEKIEKILKENNLWQKLN